MQGCSCFTRRALCSDWWALADIGLLVRMRMSCVQNTKS